MNEFYDYEIEEEVTEVAENSRDYNYRRHHKLKEQERRRRISELHYWPTMPARMVSDDGDEYYIEGAKSSSKKVHKRLSRRATRRRNDDFGGKGSFHKKHYDFWWEWF